MKIFGRTIKLKDEKYRYKTTVFLLCLFISALIWLLIKLTDEYSTTIEFPVTYSDIPEGKLLTNDLDSTVTIGLRDKGFSLVYLKYFSGKKPMDIRISDLNLKPRDDLFIGTAGTETWARRMLEDFDAEDNLEYIRPDSLVFIFENEISKKVPVLPQITTSFKKQYFAYDSMEISPEQVTVKGAENQVRNIHFIKTRQTSLNNLSSDITKTVELEKPAKAQQIKIEPAQVEVFLPVEKFTEADIVVPVKKINHPYNMRIKLFPENVHVLYLVALKDFDKVNPDMFRCTVDLSNVKNDEDKKLNVKLQNFPKFVKINRIEPSQVEFLLLK